MIWFGAILIILTILSVWRGFHHRYAKLKFKYKIYALRDELRMLAARGEIGSEDWVFDFFDNSLSKAISTSYYLTLIRLSILSVIHENDMELKEFEERLELVLESNPKLRALQKEYISSVKSYVLDQHYVSINFIVKPVVILFFGAAIAAFKLNSWMKGILVYPETSASGDFAYSS